MTLRLLASKHYCPHCDRTVWMHKRGSKYVCRGEYSASMMGDYESGKKFAGCQREYEKRGKDGSN